MIHLDRAKLCIAGLTVILTVLLVQLAVENFGQRKAVSAGAEKPECFQELLAPVRHVKQPAEGEKVCYLTFDDGPSKNTSKILDILAEHDAKATFFVIGQSLDENAKPLIKRMIDEGHAVGMHANVHSYEKLYANMDSLLRDYESLYTRLKEEYGIDTALVRFPGGSACTCMHGHGHDYVVEMEKRGFSCFDWKASGEDSVGKPTAASIQKNVFATGLKYDTPIVLLHDSSVAGKTVEALPAVLERYEKEGYRFESLENAGSYVFPKSR